MAQQHVGSCLAFVPGERRCPSQPRHPPLAEPKDHDEIDDRATLLTKHIGAGSTALHTPKMEHLFPYPKMGHSFLEVLEDPLTRKLLGHQDGFEEDALPFMLGVHTRLEFLLRDPMKHLSFLKIGYSALEAFLQASCTGPPLDFDPEVIVIPRLYTRSDGSLDRLKRDLFRSLSIDGDAVYALTPHIELFWLARVCMSDKTMAEAGFNGRRARFRVNFMHQKLLLEQSDTLKDQIYADAEVLEHQLSSRLAFGGAAAEEHFVEFLVERAQIRTFYGDDAKAREDLVHAAQTRKFQFVLTGALGKRTKFQDRDLSQLVVLAKSRDHEPEPYSSRRPSRAGSASSRKGSHADPAHRPISPTTPPPRSPVMTAHRPENLPLNDDTLLEAIHFKQHPANEAELTQVADESHVPPRLAALDPADQPLLFPMDSIILLATASSISNTSPADGLTREETAPYATRVLEGGSSNWQVYTQALLVRSRIEGYRSRTMERGLLQLQALVDQVIAETSKSSNGATDKGASTFLPKASERESASVAERLKYIYQIAPSLRWELESELAARWVHLGGLKTALEIYQRLHMHAEVALCLAGTDQEAEAIQTIRRLLFDESGQELTVLPPDGPRLYCILGDLEANPAHYERAWTVSNGRYARAKRSLGQHLVQQKRYSQAADAYEASLKIHRLNTSTWFALGCVQLELQRWPGAVESFTRAVQLDDQDGESWSNLAVALLRLPEPVVHSIDHHADHDDASPSGEARKQHDPHKTTRDALVALRKAAQLRRDDARIWDNFLTVAASIPPPSTPWSELILAQKRVLELRANKIGEKAVDASILAVLVDHVTTHFAYPTHLTDDDHSQEALLRPGTVPRQLLDLIDNHVVPIITTSERLWVLVATVSRWRRRPLAALEAYEKAWRVVTSEPGAYERDEASWDRVVRATERLCDAYQELGGQERERTGGRVLEGDWRFKARSAIRGVLGKGRGMWADAASYRALERRMAEPRRLSTGENSRDVTGEMTR